MYKPYLKCISLEMDKGREYFLSYLSTLLYLPVSLLIYFSFFALLCTKKKTAL